MHFSIKVAVGWVVLAQVNSKDWVGNEEAGGSGIWAVPMASSEQFTAESGCRVQGPQKLFKGLIPMATVGWPPGCQEPGTMARS